MIVAIILLVVSSVALVGAGFLIWKQERYGLGILTGVSGLLLIPSSITALCKVNLFDFTVMTTAPEWLALANLGFFVLCLLALIAAICMAAMVCAVLAAIGNALG